LAAANDELGAAKKAASATTATADDTLIHLTMVASSVFFLPFIHIQVAMKRAAVIVVKPYEIVVVSLLRKAESRSCGGAAERRPLSGVVPMPSFA
jgi:hypothetical protein